MAAGEGGRALGVAMSNPTLDGVKVPGVMSAEGQGSFTTLAFFGVTGATSQPAAATQATITATWVTISDGAQGFGFQTSDQIISVIAQLKQIAHVLKTLGLWKGSA